MNDVIVSKWIWQLLKIEFIQYVTIVIHVQQLPRIFWLCKILFNIHPINKLTIRGKVYIFGVQKGKVLLEISLEGKV